MHGYCRLHAVKIQFPHFFASRQKFHMYTSRWNETRCAFVWSHMTCSGHRMCMKHTATCKYMYMLKVVRKLLWKVINASRYSSDQLCAMGIPLYPKQGHLHKQDVHSCHISQWNHLFSNRNIFVSPKRMSILIYTHTAVVHLTYPPIFTLYGMLLFLPVLAASVSTINTVFITLC